MQITIIASWTAIILLAILHVISPEFAPAWRMVSEYANGAFPWVLFLFFIAWAIASWSLAWNIGKDKQLGRLLLFVSGLGAFLSAFFDINHNVGHTIATILGVPFLPVAAILISRKMPHERGSPVRLTAHLTWISLVLFAFSMFVFISSYVKSGGKMTGTPVSVLPEGTIAFNGYANRLMIVVYILWLWLAARSLKRSRA